MDKVGAIYSNRCATLVEIEEKLDPVISAEASSEDTLAVIGGGTCGDCMFAGSSSAAEPWPCLSCPKFQLYEDADLQPLWDILQERKSFMMNENGEWNDRFDSDIHAQFQRYETLLISAEMHRRDAIASHVRIKEDVE